MLESALVAFAVALSDFVSFERSSKTALAAGEGEVKDDMFTEQTATKQSNKESWRREEI